MIPLFTIQSTEIAILQSLARQLAEIAADPVQSKKATCWSRLTDLDASVRPMLLTHLWPLAWSQVLPDDRTLRCQHATARRYERDLRQRIWTATNLTDDTVVEPVIRYPHGVSIQPYGGLRVEKRYAIDDHEKTGAAVFLPEIHAKNDIEKIGDPIVTVDWELRESCRQEAEAVFGGILDVLPDGIYFAAKVVDEWVELRGMNQVYLDMVDDPDWMHEALQIMTDNFRSRFLQCEELGVWGPWDMSDPLGSTGLRFNPDIPNYAEIFERGGRLRLNESWAFTCAEAFTQVSPRMHDRFAFKYDRQLMPLFKYANIGCCEVLSDRIDCIRSIPNARRITVSEWADLERAANAIGTDFVYGYKPSGVPFISEPWEPEMIHKEIHTVLEASRGCPLEIILNIGGTLGKNADQQLIEWNQIAKQEIESFQARR